MCTEVGARLGYQPNHSDTRSPLWPPLSSAIFQAHFSDSPGFLVPSGGGPPPCGPQPSRRAPEDMGYRPCGDTSSAGGCPGSSRRKPPGQCRVRQPLPASESALPGSFSPAQPAVPGPDRSLSHAKLGTSTDSSAPAPSSSSSILWPAGAREVSRGASGTHSKKVSSATQGPRRAHLGALGCRLSPGEASSAQIPLPAGACCRRAPGRGEAPPGAGSRFPSAFRAPGPAGRLPLTLFWLLRFAPGSGLLNSALPSAKRPQEGERRGWSGGPEAPLFPRRSWSRI